MDKILRRRLATKQISTGLSVWQIHKFGHLCSFCWKVIRHFFPSFPQFAACVLLAGPGPGFLSQFSYHCHCNYSDESRSRQPTLDNSSREEIVQMFHLASGAVLRYFWCCHSTKIDKEMLKVQEMQTDNIIGKHSSPDFFISQVITPPYIQSLE